MPHIVTQACCGDASCVFACPVNCIHPTPDEPGFATSEMVYIDPNTCVDCGACVSACPVGAISPDTKLTEDQKAFVDINAMFFTAPKTYPPQAPIPQTVKLTSATEALRVAVVGSGPAALYAADELLKQSGVQVNVFDRLPTPHGLVRAGVAPDHTTTKTIDDLFRQIEDQDGFGYFLNVEVGRDVTHRELLDHHHAVIYATGASHDRALGIPGEDLPGSGTATEFVGWYNGHPDHADRVYDLSHRRVVIVGNGNVALDVARILTTDPDALAQTDIADHALAALRASNIEEVVLLARRGVAQAAYTLPELIGLLSHTDADIVVDPRELTIDPATEALRASGELDPVLDRKIRAIEEASTAASGTSKRIVFRYLTSPTEVLGSDKVAGVQIARNDLVVGDGGTPRAVATGDTEVVDAGLVLRSIGYRGVPVAELPFDPHLAVIPNESGRVRTTSGSPMPGAYVVGWIKRGPTGFIGTNKTCAHETVSNVLADFNAGALGEPNANHAALRALIGRRQPDVIDVTGWRAIDLAERARGHAAGRTRQKFTHVSEMVGAARRERRGGAHGKGRGGILRAR